MNYSNSQLNAINLDGLKYEEEGYYQDEWSNYPYNYGNNKAIIQQYSTMENTYNCESVSSYDSQGEISNVCSVQQSATSCSNCLDSRKCFFHNNVDMKYSSYQETDGVSLEHDYHPKNCVSYDALDESSQYLYNHQDQLQAVSSCQYNVDSNMNWDVSKIIDNDSKIYNQLVTKTKSDEKRERRRKQNRVAAKKCRERKKNRMMELLREYKRLEAAHKEVNEMLSKVQKEKQKLEQVIAIHAKTCKTVQDDTKPFEC